MDKHHYMAMLTQKISYRIIFSKKWTQPTSLSEG